MSLNKIKRALRRILPHPVFDVIQRIRRRWHRPPTEVAILRERFDELQRGLSNESLFCLREGIILKVYAQSKEPFSWFCWRSPEMVREHDFFISRISGVRSFTDVGANYGIFLLVFLKLYPSGKALSVDPSPLADRIRKKIGHSVE